MLRILRILIIATACTVFSAAVSIVESAALASVEADRAIKIEYLSDRTLGLLVTHPAGMRPQPLDLEVFDSGGRQVTIVSLSRSQKVTDYKQLHRPWVSSRWVATLAQPLRPNQAYRLHINRTLERPLVFDPEQLSSSIQINQIGFLPQGPKSAELGNWTGSEGMRIQASHFELRSAITHQPVYSAPIEDLGEDRVWSGHHRYRAEFSSFQQPGHYYLWVEGLGRSHRFSIGADIYSDLARTVFKSFYHHRNGLELGAPFADLAYQKLGRGVTPEFSGVFHAAVENYPLSRGEVEGQPWLNEKGWFDAGDFGQYITNAAPVWFWFSLAQDTAPQALASDQLGIPESGNGCPDLIDELDWGFSWALSMQDTDGGVYWRAASETWDETLPKDLERPRFVYQKTTHATASFAALAAIHARMAELCNPARSATALDAALRAWNYLDQRPSWPEEGQPYINPVGTHAGDYPDRSDRDNRLWAAVELHRTTGQPRFSSYFLSEYAKLKYDPTNITNFANQQMAALWSWLHTDHTDIESRAFAERTVRAGLDWYVNAGSNLPYGAMMHHHSGWMGWGSFGISTRPTAMLFAGYIYFNDARYLEWALRSPDIQLGKNPLGLSFITGVGARSAQNPVSQYQRIAEIDTPIPGLPLNGPHAGLPESLQAHRVVNEQYQPSIRNQEPGVGYPAMRRYVDSRLIPPMSEPTVATYANVASAYLLLDAFARGEFSK